MTEGNGTSIASAMRYSAYGKREAQAGTEEPATLRQWAGAHGYEREPYGAGGLDLHYLEQRYYEADSGRFISRDPIRWAGGLNLYAYTENDPVNSVDPNGLVRSGVPPGYWGQISGGRQPPARVVLAAGFAVLAAPTGLGGVVIATALGSYIGSRLDGNGVGDSLKNAAWDGGSTYVIGRLGGLAAQRIGAATARQAAWGSVAELEAALSRFAADAHTAVGPGSGAAHGTRVHTAFRTLVESFKRQDVLTEASYLNGERAKWGTPGSVRIDALRLEKGQVTHVYDLKTGNARLTAQRIAQIRRHLPNDGAGVVFKEIR